jgi:hypothetical protein
MAETMTNDLTAKVGPLPAWVWGAGAVGGFMFWRHHKLAASAAADAAAVNDPNNIADPNAQTDPSASDATVTDLTGGSYGVPSQGYDPFASLQGQSPGYNVSPTGGISNGTVPGPTTDLQWSTLAANYLLSTGSDPSTIQTALSKYLSGTALSSAEQTIVNAALRQFGSPPEGTIPVVVVPTPTPTPTPSPTPTPTPTPTPSTAAPAAPHVTGQELANRSVVFKWNRPTGAVAFALYLNGKWFKLQPGTQHTSGIYHVGYHYGPFAVRAVGVTGKMSALSNGVTVTIK